MDTITHALFGLVIYRSIDKEGMSKEAKRALLFTSVAGSEIPDIDVVSQLWDTGGRYLMWHRGITHSVLLVPFWAALLTVLSALFWRIRNRAILKKIALIGLLAVFIHDTADIFNAWGTGYLEPFTNARLTFGTVSIVDPLLWIIIAAAFIISQIKRQHATRIFRGAACLVLLQFLSQSVQGYTIYQSMKENYDKIVLTANFVPGSFQVIGKKEGQIEITKVSLWDSPQLLHTLPTADDADLTELFAKNPEAKTLHEWAPLVAVINDEKRLAIYDPRFYTRGESFLYEFIDK